MQFFLLYLIIFKQNFHPKKKANDNNNEDISIISHHSSIINLNLNKQLPVDMKISINNRNENMIDDIIVIS